MPPPGCPIILYVHGGGWILGNAGTHDRLVRELAVGADAAAAFVEYDRSPEARYPVVIEQAYARLNLPRTPRQGRWVLAPMRNLLIPSRFIK